MSGAGLTDSIFKWADMFHDNMNQSIDIFGDQAIQVENLEEGRRQFDKQFNDQHLLNMLAARGEMRKQDRKRQMMNAWANRSA